MLKKRKVRTRGRKYPRRKVWIERRDAAFSRAGDSCEITKEPLGFYRPVLDGDPPEEADLQRWRWQRAADHIWPEKFVRRFVVGADPHILENLIVITPKLHAEKTAIEWKIYRGDYIGYAQELRRIGFDQVVIDRAMKALVTSVKK